MTRRALHEHRTPYVGSGEDGARRSAEIDATEAEGLSWSDERRDALIESAERWRDQAHELVLERVGARPTLDQVRQDLGSEDWLAALALAELCPNPIQSDLAQWTRWSRTDGRLTYDGEGEDRVSTFHPDAVIDWPGWIADVETSGRGWSSTESRLFELIAGVVERHPVVLADVLGHLGSWEARALAVVVEWASGGNQVDRRGRYTVVPVLRGVSER